MATSVPAGATAPPAAAPPRLPSEDLYPARDGKPMGETLTHVRGILSTVFALDALFRDQPDVLVGANQLMYYEEGNPGARVEPDVYVIKGVPRGLRRSIFVWVEGKAPDVIVELTSQSTWREDTVSKRALYARLGVKEYWQWDPLDEYLRPPLLGYQLIAQASGPGGEYVPIARLPGPGLSYVSGELGVELHLRDGWLRFRRRDTGEWLPLPEEGAEAVTRLAQEAAARQQAEAELAYEASARREAEQELARLRAELERLRGGRRGASGTG